MDWPGRFGYLSAERKVWLIPADDTKQSSSSKSHSTITTKTGTMMAGWVQSFENLTELIVNGAGHLAPMNQPQRLYSMLQTFINGDKFLTN